MAKDLANRVAQRAETAPAPTSDTDKTPAPRSIYSLIDAQRSEIARALPKHMDADRLARIAVTTLRQTPRLLECTSTSLLGALMLSAQLGLEPGPLGHCYFVPFWNKNAEWTDAEGRKRKGSYEVTWMIGYKGIIDLARRSGQLLSIEARPVYTNDHFEFAYGLDDRLEHRPALDSDRGEIRAFYGIARFKDGGRYFVVLSKDEVDAHRSRSKSKDDGPWVTDYVPMGCKTVVRVMAPFLPLSPELAGAMEHDDAVHRDIAPDMIEMPPPPRVIEGHVAEVVDDQPDEKATNARATVEDTEQPAAAATDEKPAAVEAEAPAAAAVGDEPDACPACGAIPSHTPSECPMAAELEADLARQDAGTTD
jgi:recombination protein RecT